MPGGGSADLAPAVEPVDKMLKAVAAGKKVTVQSCTINFVVTIPGDKGSGISKKAKKKAKKEAKDKDKNPTIILD